MVTCDARGFGLNKNPPLQNKAQLCCSMLDRPWGQMWGNRESLTVNHTVLFPLFQQTISPLFSVWLTVGDYLLEEVVGLLGNCPTGCLIAPNQY